MNPAPKKSPSIRNDPRVEIGLVQVDIGRHSEPCDHFANLILKRAKDVLKDALVTSAECRGGKLSSWNDDGGTFAFLIESPDSLNQCCLAAIQMLEQLPWVKREAQLPADLERMMVVHIACDAGTVLCGPERDNLRGNFVDDLKKHVQIVSAENQVTITDRVFRQLNKTLQARFVKWTHSTELGVDLYHTAAPRPTIGLVLADFTREQATPAEDQPSSERPAPASSNDLSPEQRPSDGVKKVLGSRKMQSAAAAILGVLMILGVVCYITWPTSPPEQRPSWAELVQTPEWRSWRKQMHDKLSAGQVTEKTLADALKIKMPARPEQAAAALRRDQAIADVLMAYPDVRLILNKRFGIYEDSFLGTGLSKPVFSSSNYGAAAVHEYLIRNLDDNHPAVWMRILDPNKNPRDMTMTIQELFENDPKTDDQKKPWVKEIAQRVKEKDAINPVMIRFARLDAIHYSRKLGRPERHRVFASNLAEVWNLRVRDAAHLSGYTFDKGDSVYIWVFLPHDPIEVVPATWGEVLSHLPAWLSEIDKN